MNPRKNPTFIKRRQYYIKKDFQTRFIAKFVLILFAGGLLSIGLIFFNTQGTLTSVYANSKLSIQNTSIAIMPSVVITTLITTMTLGAVVVVLTLLVSHKIAGPMFRFENDIDRISRWCRPGTPSADCSTASSRLESSWRCSGFSNALI